MGNGNPDTGEWKMGNGSKPTLLKANKISVAWKTH
jgi:hypothetical protein